MILGHHTLRSYDQRLEDLLALILEMGGLVGQMVLDAKKSLRIRDEALVQEAKEADRRINALDSAIEEEATIILALQNPMAIDLRFVTSAIKIAGILERAGDLAKNIVKRSAKLGDFQPEEVITQLEAMADSVSAMLHDALDAFKGQSEEKATAVWKRDDEVDEYYHNILHLMQAEMQKNPEIIQSGTHIVFAAKNFERVADYATNLAKTVYYVTSGARPDKTFLKNQE